MALFPLLAVFLVACIPSDVIAAGQDDVWKSRPGTVVNKWEGEDLKLNWSLKQDKYVQVESIQWFNEKSTRTLMLYNVDSNTSKIGDDYYKDRVVLLQDTNAGIILRNLTKADEGGYLINVEGPSILKQDTANVRVHNVWESRPGNVTAWEGGNLVLDWSLKQDAYIHVESIQWYNENSTRTIMIHNIASNTSQVGDAYYKGRVELLTGTNAGVILRNVTKADEGWYLINVDVPPMLKRDRAHVTVYNIPRVRVDNEAVSPDATLDKSHSDQSLVTVVICQDWTANTTISLDGTILKTCQDDQQCSTIIPLKEFSSTTLPLHIKVSNGISDPLALKYHIINEKDHVLSSSNEITIGIVILIILVIIAVLVSIGVWIVLRNRQKDNKPLKSWQKSYIKRRFLYGPLTKIKRWSSLNGGGTDLEMAVESQGERIDGSDNNAEDANGERTDKVDDVVQPQPETGQNNGTDTRKGSVDSQPNCQISFENDSGQKPPVQHTDHGINPDAMGTHEAGDEPTEKTPLAASSESCRTMSHQNIE